MNTDAIESKLNNYVQKQLNQNCTQLFIMLIIFKTKCLFWNNYNIKSNAIVSFDKNTRQCNASYNTTYSDSNENNTTKQATKSKNKI